VDVLYTPYKKERPGSRPRESRYVAFFRVAIGLVVAFGVPVFGIFPAHITQWLMQAGLGYVAAWGVMNIICKASAVAIILAIVSFWEGVPLSTLGLRPISIPVAAGAIGVSILCFWSSGLMNHILSVYQLLPFAEFKEITPAQFVMTLPLWITISDSIANAIAEELGCRAYALTRLSYLVRSTKAAVVISWVAVLAAHIPFWGIRGALALAPGELLFIVLFLWGRSLPANIVAHFITDMLASVIWPMLPTVIKLNMW
jgi:membrane protease YdiL (CAAX protease family)